MRSDPNGYDWEALGYSSLEAFIESKAGAVWPCTDSSRFGGWPMPVPPPFTPPDDEGEAEAS